MSCKIAKTAIRALFAASSALWLVPAASAQSAQAGPLPSDQSTAKANAANEAAPVANPGIQATDSSQDIVVTAERRESTVQRTPISITAVTGSDLTKQGVTGIEAIAGKVPGLAVNNESGVVKVNIRGLGLNAFGPGTEGNVAVYANGVYLAHANEIGSQFLDVARLEVLRGPQGTLYGRNSTGGALNIVANAPTNEMAAGIVGSYGNYDAVTVEGFVSGPVVEDKLKVRFAGRYEKHDGYARNVFLDTRFGALEQYGFRGTVEANPTEAVTITVAADYSHGDDTSVYAHYLGAGQQRRFAQQLVSKALDPTAAAAYVATLPAITTNFWGPTNPLGANGLSLRPDLLYQNTTPVSTRTYWGLNGTVAIDLSDQITLKSVTGYRDGQYSNLYDLDRTTNSGVIYRQAEKWHQLSEELQLLGNFDSLQWILGGFYLDDKSPDIRYDFVSPNLLGPGLDYRFIPYGSAATKAYAVFGQATYAFTPALKLTLGGRYNHEKRSRNEFFSDNTTGPAIITGPATPSRVTFDKFTPKATIQFEPNSRFNLYATVSEGYKAGGFLVTAYQAPVQPETLWAYEAGVKTRFLDDAVQLNASVYHYDYKNIQLPSVAPSGLVTVVENAARARINGAEAELVIRPVRGVRILANGSYIDGKFKQFQTRNPTFLGLGTLDLAGNQLPFNSKWAYFVEGSYTFELPGGSTIEAAGSYDWRDKKYFDAFNLENAYQPAVGMVDARLRYTLPGKKTYVEAFGRNLTNEFVVSQAYVSGNFSAGYGIGAQREIPRIYGVRVGLTY